MTQPIRPRSDVLRAGHRLRNHGAPGRRPQLADQQAASSWSSLMADDERDKDYCHTHKKIERPQPAPEEKR